MFKHINNWQNNLTIESMEWNKIYPH